MAVYDDTTVKDGAGNEHYTRTNTKSVYTAGTNERLDHIITKRRGVPIRLTTAGWVASSTYAKYPFKQTIPVSAMTAIEGVPIECVPLPAAGIKTDAETVAYGLVKEAYGDSTALAVYFYATALPVTDISYSVKEVLL